MRRLLLCASLTVTAVAPAATRTPRSAKEHPPAAVAPTLSPEAVIGTWSNEGEQTSMTFRADGTCSSAMRDCDEGPCAETTVRCQWKVGRAGALSVRFPPGANRRNPLELTLGVQSGKPVLRIDGEYAFEKVEDTTSGPVDVKLPFHVCGVRVVNGTCESETPKPLRLAATLCYQSASQQTVSGSDCRSLYRAVRALHPGRTVRSDAHAVEILPGLIRRGSKVLLDHATGGCQELACASDFINHETKLLSFVGPYLTWSETVADASAGGPPYHSEEWVSYALDKNAPADLLDAFAETSLIDALKADGWVQGNLTEADRAALEAAHRYRDVRTLLASHGFLKSGFERFAVYGYDAKKNRAAVRIGFKRPEAGFAANKVHMLGLWLTPTPTMRRALTAASRGRGFFMSTKNVDRFIQ